MRKPDRTKTEYAEQQPEIVDESGIIFSVDGFTLYDATIRGVIADVCADLEIEDLRKEKHLVWKSVLQYVGERVFNKNTAYYLKQHSNIYINNTITETNCNSYNFEVVQKLADYYIKLSRSYNKVVSLTSFGLFSSIPYNTLSEWGRARPGKSSPESYCIYKTLHNSRYDDIKDSLIDNGNVIGILQIGETDFGLRSGNAGKIEDKREISIAEIVQRREEREKRAALVQYSEDITPE